MPRQPNAASRNRRAKGEKCRAPIQNCRAPSRKCRARRVKCRARPLTTLSTLKTLPTRRARKPPRAAPRPVIVRGRVPKHPPYAGHDSRARFGRPKASSLIPLGARIAGATAEAARCGIVRKFAGRSCAASSLSSDKGATPAGGGKPSAYPPSDSESRSDALAGVQIQSKLV